MDSSQSSNIYKLEKEKFRENVSRAEKKLEEIKMMYRNYKENLETLEDDAMSALNDTAGWIERARRLYVEAAEAKQWEFRLRNRIATLERKASQTRRQPKQDGGKPPQRPGNPSRTERILATCVTCVGSVLVYGLYQVTAPFLI